MSRTRSSDGRPARPTPHEDQDVDSWGDDVQSSDEAAAGGAADAEEAALDLEDLDRLDGDGAFHATADGAEDDVVLEKARRRPRSPLLSLFVIAFAAYLLATMWSDFRYWMRGSEPVDLGQASSFVKDGRVPSGYHDMFVVLEGTPDVQHAARMTTNEGFVGYLRVTEGGGQLFAAVPRGPDEQVTNNFEGRYTGRMRRLGSDRAFPWLEQFFDAERITRSIDTTAQDLVEALQRGGAALDIETAEGPIRLDPEDRVRLVVERPEARVQLGVTTFPDAAAAEARVAALGYPYVAAGAATTFHTFLVRIPMAERAAAHDRLAEGLDLPEATSDPKVGVSVLPMKGTFTVPASLLQLDGSDTLVFPYGDNTTAPGYQVEGERLVERGLDESETLRIAADELAAVRLEQPIRLDPDGYVILVGAAPSSARMLGILWLVALGIGLVNLASLLLWWRRRA